MPTFQGMFPALFTPVNDAGEFRPDSFERLLTRCYRAGVNGIYVCGQTGEGLQLSAAQRKRVAEAAVQSSPPDKTIIVHTGAMATAEALDLTRHAARIGAHAVSALPPLPNYSFAEIKAYYTALAAASELPLLIYYFPAYAPSVSSLDLLLELCAIPNVIGLKFTANDLFMLSEVKKTGAVVFYGTDEQVLAGLAMGADGGIGTFYNLVPEQFVRLYEMARADQWDAARKLQLQINELIAVGLRLGVMPAAKLMMQRLGIDCGACIAPRRQLTPAEIRQMDEMIAASEFLSSLLG
jgi:N-acetylneuraminate lyase